MARRFNRSRSSVNVDEEYARALRTKSYVDMWSKVHHQLHRTMSTTSTTPTHDEEIKKEEIKEDVKFHTHSSPLSYLYYSHLPDFLLEPSQETLLAATSVDTYNSHHLPLHCLLTDFFDTTLQACTACTSLLASINRARSHHRSLRHRLLNLLSSPSPPPSAFSDLTSHLNLDNPLSPENLAQFHHIHALYTPLVRSLTSAHRKILRRIKLLRITKKVSAVTIIAAIGAVAMVAVAIAAHVAVAVGVAAAPVVMGPAEKWVRRRVQGVSVGYWERAGVRVDVAAKGAYIVGRDMDTMSRMVRRVHDEVEHGRDVARMVVRNRERQLVREVVKEMEDGEVGLEEQLEELEEHVFLCLITINRSRRMVAQEIMGPSEET